MTAVGTALVGARRGDAEALIEAGRTSARGIQVVLQRCNAIVSETRAELRGVAQLMRAIGARKSVTELDKLALALVVLSIDSVRELAAIASATQREALDILAGRLQSDLKEFQAIRSRNKT